MRHRVHTSHSVILHKGNGFLTLWVWTMDCSCGWRGGPVVEHTDATALGSMHILGEWWVDSLWHGLVTVQGCLDFNDASAV